MMKPIHRVPDSIEKGLRFTRMETPTELSSSRRIVADGRHNAFAAFVRWHGLYWLAFRKGSGHIARDGDMVVQQSTDAEHWEQSLTLDVSGDDRDAQLLPTEGRLFLYINSLNDGVFQTSVASTEDGIRWSDPQPIYRSGYILWKPVIHEGRYYAAAHRPGPPEHREVHLVTSEDGISWQKISTIRAGQGESETTLLFGRHGELTAFLRSEVTLGGAILESEPPYAHWTERPAGVHLSGHAVYTFEGVTYLMGRLLAYEPAADPATLRADLAGRSLHQATIVYIYDEGQLHPYCRLGPLAGNHDSSYPAAVQDEDGMLIVYHRAAHEFAGEHRTRDAADLFLSRVPLQSSAQ
jgi:hypothetical protein